ncbi:MAG: hypothetical protein NVS1B7_6530 [Candidatus Saccharimonadales bacterium]
MKVSRSQLATVIGERVVLEPNIKILALEVAAYLISDKREHDLESLTRDILSYREQHGIVEANISSAHDLGTVIKKDVAKLLKHYHPDAQHVIIRETHDPSVIGGLKVQTAHAELDMTIRSKLDTFKRLTAEGTK